MFSNDQLEDARFFATEMCKKKDQKTLEHDLVAYRDEVVRLEFLIKTRPASSNWDAHVENLRDQLTLMTVWIEASEGATKAEVGK